MFIFGLKLAKNQLPNANPTFLILNVVGNTKKMKIFIILLTLYSLASCTNKNIEEISVLKTEIESLKDSINVFHKKDFNNYRMIFAESSKENNLGDTYKGFGAVFEKSNNITFSVFRVSDTNRALHLDTFALNQVDPYINFEYKMNSEIDKILFLVVPIKDNGVQVAELYYKKKIQ
jgi:hypothetical protein